MCLFRRKKQVTSHAREPQIELASMLKANGIDLDIVELIVNKYGINNKNFKMRKDSPFGDVEILSDDSISYCGYLVDSHISISFTLVGKTLVKIYYLFDFTPENIRNCTESDCRKASAVFQTSNPSFSFHTAAENKIELIIKAESSEIYLDPLGTCEANLTNLMWHLDDEKTKIKLAFDSLLSH